MACAGPLGEMQVAEAVVGQGRCAPAADQRGEAERVLPVAPALGESPERTQGPRQPCPDSNRSVLGVPASRSAALHAPPQKFGRPAELPEK